MHVKFGRGLRGVVAVTVAWRLIAPLLLCSSSLSTARADETVLSSPEATIRAFEKAINLADAAKMADCVNGSVTPAVPLTTLLASDAVVLHTTIETPQVTGDTAKVAVWSEVIVRKTNHKITYVAPREVLTLRRSGTKWLLQPGDQKSLLSSCDFLGSMIGYTKYPKQAKSPVHTAEAAECAMNVKMLSLAMLQLMQDHDVKIAATPATFKAKTMIYIKSEEAYHCPTSSDQSSSYSLNPDIAGKSLGELDAPAEIVMVYEGRDKHLNFHHDGRAVVGFVDGKCRLVDPIEAKRLKWK